ncbi:hypothetical protein RhiJN_02307 [Ceratobasidium sp. AG-Ba]|nr:hypothetical protein RhiJN_02307 [Ceratobasidium sp. AG-Ba]QRW03238.1 hypothetical protein RhiLY_02237 [Ceratobasidium sp. AG-Ba]
MYNGVLGTYSHPDDTPGDLPYNATTPPSNTSPAFRNQAVAHAGYDLIDNTFLAIHGVQEGKWSLCTDSRDRLPVLTYEAAASRDCQSTYVAVYP